ncbi:MAG: hypothetical protein RXQ96_06395 [Thermocladium sp.]|nr:MAG: hypothetical protein AT710_04260 [Thermocladium sp. ECH_B]
MEMRGRHVIALVTRRGVWLRTAMTSLSNQCIASAQLLGEPESINAVNTASLFRKPYLERVLGLPSARIRNISLDPWRIPGPASTIEEALINVAVMHAFMQVLRGVRMGLSSSTLLLNMVLHDLGLGFDVVKYRRATRVLGNDAYLGCGFLRALIDAATHLGDIPPERDGG